MFIDIRVNARLLGLSSLSSIIAFVAGPSVASVVPSVVRPSFVVRPVVISWKLSNTDPGLLYTTYYYTLCCYFVPLFNCYYYLDDRWLRDINTKDSEFIASLPLWLCRSVVIIIFINSSSSWRHPNNSTSVYVFIARQHTDGRYWYSKSVCLSVRPFVRPSVRPSVTFRYQMKTA